MMSRGYRFFVDEAREAMGIDWLPTKDISQAIPPAYTQWIGEQLMPAVLANRAHQPWERRPAQVLEQLVKLTA